MEAKNYYQTFEEGEYKEIEITDFKDVKVVCLFWGAEWCPPCKSFTKKLIKFYKYVNNYIN